MLLEIKLDFSEEENGPLLNLKKDFSVSGTILAHKGLLSFISPVFKQMFFGPLKSQVRYLFHIRNNFFS